MLDSDSERPLQNSLHKRFDQLKRWKESDTFRATESFRDAVRVKFPMGTQFLAACSSGDIEEAARLLRKGVDVNTANVDGLTALHQACIDNDLELVEFLIKHGSDIDVKDNEGWTPLHATASCAYTEVAKYLLSEGADLAAVNNDGDLAVDLADNQEMESMLTDEMLRRGIDVDKARGVEEQRMRKDAQRWLKSGRYVEVLDPKSGASPLHVAAAKGYIEVLQLILQCPNVNVNCRDNDGWTPMHAAAHWGQERACEMLCEHNADMDALTNAAQDIFEIAEPDLLAPLRMLKNKQMSRRLAASSEITEPLPRKEGGGKRRSSVTRMSVDQKASVTSKIAEQEGIGGTPASGGAGDATTISLPSPVEEEAAPDVRPWVKRRQQLAAAVEAEIPPKVERKEEPKNEEKQKIPDSPAAAGSGEVPAAPAAPAPTPVVPAVEPSAPSPSAAAAAAAAALSSASSTAAAAAAAAAARAKAELAAAASAQKKPTTLENISENKAASPEKTIESPTAAAPDVLTQDESSKTNGVEQPASAPPPGMLNQRRVDSASRRADKRVSAVMAPMKGEESETQRSARARHARATRRSTQGVSQDELQEAKKLLQTDPTRANSSATTATPSSAEVSAPPAQPSGVSKEPEKSMRVRNGREPAEERVNDAKKAEESLVSAEELTSTGLPTTRSRRHQRRHAPITSTDGESSKEITTPSVRPPSSSTTSTRLSGSEALSEPKTTTRTSKSDALDGTGTNTTTATTPSTTSTGNLSRYSRPASTIETSTSRTKASSPGSWRSRTGYSGAGGSNSYNSSLTRTPTFHGSTSTTLASSPSDRQSDEASESGSSSSRLTSATTTIGAGEDSDWKARRRARRAERPPSGKTATEAVTPPTSGDGGPQPSGRTDSGRYSLHGDSTDNLRPSSQLRPNSYHDSTRPYSRYGSSTSDSSAPDYKKLYEQEKLESERLRKELEQAKKELTDTRSEADRLRKVQGSNSADTRRLERKLSEYEEEIKLAEKMRAENEKLKAENRALARVVARLSREQ